MSQVAPTPTRTPGPAADRRSSERQNSGTGSHSTPVIVGVGASFEGWLTCREAARIEGEFRGNVLAEGRIELGVEADVSGRIEARDIVVAGSFDGKLFASRSIELLATARVTGELHARELSAAEGCVVTGLCRTGSVPRTTPEVPPEVPS